MSKPLRWELRVYKLGGATVHTPLDESGWATQEQIDLAVEILARLTAYNAPPDFDGCIRP